MYVCNAKSWAFTATRSINILETSKSFGYSYCAIWLQFSLQDKATADPVIATFQSSYSIAAIRVQTLRTVMLIHVQYMYVTH